MMMMKKFRIFFKTILILLILAFSLGKETYLLIHGATLGAWSWYKVKAGLEKRGHTVIALDLPSLGIDNTDVLTVQLQDHVDSVLAIIDRLTKPAIVVGHSYGGVIVSLVSEARPEKIKKAVYLAAIMLQNGGSVLNTLQYDTKSLSPANSIVTSDSNGNPVTFNFNVDSPGLKEAMYADCKDEDITLFKLLTKPHPMSTFTKPVSIGVGFNSVSKVYILALQDKTITAEFQREMYSKFPDTKAYDIDASHMALLSKPDKLVEILIELKGN